jgi:hypothetical protein
MIVITNNTKAEITSHLPLIYTAHYVASKRKTIGISTDRPSWLGGVEDVGTAISGYEGHLVLSILTGANLTY